MKDAPRPSMGSSLKTHMPCHVQPTNPMPVRRAKNNMINRLFGPALPNAVRSTATVDRASSPSCGGSCALTIRARVTSARIRPGLRHGRGRCRFAKRPSVSSNFKVQATSVLHSKRCDQREGLPGLKRSTYQSDFRWPSAALQSAAAVACNLGARKTKSSAPKAAPAVVAGAKNPAK